MFISCVTYRRHPSFTNPAACEFTIADLCSKCSTQIEVTCYCLMPDHGHLLLTNLHSDADIPATVHRWKQTTGFWYAATYAKRLWQANYWDQLLRDVDDTFSVCRYIISDPVRQGLARKAEDYPWWGSQRWSRQDLAQGLRV